MRHKTSLPIGLTASALIGAAALLLPAAASAQSGQNGDGAHACNGAPENFIDNLSSGNVRLQPRMPPGRRCWVACFAMAVLCLSRFGLSLTIPGEW